MNGMENRKVQKMKTFSEGQFHAQDMSNLKADGM